MNIALWILQVLLALHTVMGAVWKFMNSEQAVPSLSAMPHGAWLALSGLEVLCAVALVLPAFRGKAAVMGALGIAGEMLLFSALHLASSGSAEHGQLIYWLVVCGLCAVVAVGRLRRRTTQAGSAG